MALNIAILGAGIMGTTCATRVIEKFPNSKITIFAKDRSPNTTSDVSAGYWEPYCLSDDSIEEKKKIIKWGKETYDVMMKLALSENASNSGVQTMSAYVFQNTDKPNTPFWSTIVSQYRELDQNEVNSITSRDMEAKSAFHFITTTVNVSKYLKILTLNLEKLGVNFVDKTLSSLTDFIQETKSSNFDYIINCTGLGSREFCNDLNMHPVRGQVIRVRAPWIKNCLMLDYEVTYILPLDDLVVLGGSKELDDYNLIPNENDCQEIFNRCCKIMPSLKDAEIVTKSSGLRPFRSNGIRLEMEILNNYNTETKVIHNYGHGGSGITLSWGCATNIVEILQNDLLK